MAGRKVQPLWDHCVKPVLAKGWMTEAVARATFGTRMFESSSARMQAFYNGVSDAMGWPVDKVVLLDQSGSLDIWSVPGDSDASDVNQTFLQPFVAYALGHGRSLTEGAVMLRPLRPHDSIGLWKRHNALLAAVTTIAACVLT